MQDVLGVLTAMIYIIWQLWKLQTKAAAKKKEEYPTLANPPAELSPSTTVYR
jgi:hypothetical protein